MTTPYPLLMMPILKEKVWGGRRLSRYNKQLPARTETLVGESWELADLASTSPTGGGGDAARSLIANGPLCGKSISDAISVWGPLLFGPVAFAEQQRQQSVDVPSFPLLLKFLDAREHLSVQVHPSPEYAATHPDAHLKTESWYILDAEPVGQNEPTLFIGLREGTTRDDLVRSISDQSIASMLIAHPAVPGQCFTLPSGTLHALGAGVLVAEVQTASDTTFRVYDWTREYPRPNRALHIEQSLACLTFPPPPPPPPASSHAPAPWPSGEHTPPDGLRETHVARLASTAYYTIDELSWAAGKGAATPDAPGLSLDAACCLAIMVVAGTLTLASRDAHWPALDLAAGHTVLIPADCLPDVSLTNANHARILVVSIDPASPTRYFDITSSHA